MLLGFSIWKTAEIPVTLEGEIEAKFEAFTKRVDDVREIANSTTAKIEEIDKAQNSVIREIMNLQSFMYEIKDHTKYHEIPREPEAKPQNDFSVRE